jgi:hypothetical protein
MSSRTSGRSLVAPSRQFDDCEAAKVKHCAARRFTACSGCIVQRKGAFRRARGLREKSLIAQRAIARIRGRCVDRKATMPSHSREKCPLPNSPLPLQIPAALVSGAPRQMARSLLRREQIERLTFSRTENADAWRNCEGDAWTPSSPSTMLSGARASRAAALRNSTRSQPRA